MSSRAKQDESVGISRREYGRRTGIAHSYVNRLVERGVIRPLRNGNVDPAQADRARAQCTIVGRGQTRHKRRVAREETIGDGSVRFCEVCGQHHWQAHTGHCIKCDSTYGLTYAEHLGSPDPERYCSAKCAGIPEVKPKQLICEQCGDPAGYILEEARVTDSADPSRWCDRWCSDDAQNGVTRKQTRRRIRLHAEDDGANKAELKQRGYADW